MTITTDTPPLPLAGAGDAPLIDRLAAWNGRGPC